MSRSGKWAECCTICCPSLRSTRTRRRQILICSPIRGFHRSEEHTSELQSLTTRGSSDLYEPVRKVGGMLHYMLPESSLDQNKAAANPYMFADTGIPQIGRAHV